MRIVSFLGSSLTRWQISSVREADNIFLLFFNYLIWWPLLKISQIKIKEKFYARQPCGQEMGPIWNESFP